MHINFPSMRNVMKLIDKFTEESASPVEGGIVKL